MYIDDPIGRAIGLPPFTEPLPPPNIVPLNTVDVPPWNKGLHYNLSVPSSHMMGENNPSHARMAAGTHNFQQSGFHKWVASVRPPPSEQQKQKTSLSLRNAASERRLGVQNQPIVTCPHCNKVGARNNMTRYHFDKCKFKPMT